MLLTAPLELSQADSCKKACSRSKMPCLSYLDSHDTALGREPLMEPGFPETDDPGYNSDGSDGTSSPYITMADSRMETIVVGGRDYPMHYPHPLAVDEYECDRLEKQTRLYIDVFGEKCFPVGARKVLDILTGTGCWALECADRNPSSVVEGLDIIPHMIPHWTSPNCHFLMDEDLIDPKFSDLGNSKNIDFIRVGDTGGDDDLLELLLRKAYQDCAPSGIVQIWGTRVNFTDPDGNTALHRLYFDLQDAWMSAQRALDLPIFYRSKLRQCGFTDIHEEIFLVPLTSENDLIRIWASGFEAYSMKLMNEHLSMSDDEIKLKCWAAREELRRGVDGVLQIRVSSGRKPKAQPPTH